MKVWRRATVVALLLTLWAGWAADRRSSPAAGRFDPELRPAILYFGHPEAMGVTPEVRWVRPEQLTPEWLLQALVAGPLDPGLVPVIPPAARVLGVERRGETITVDFSAAIVRDHPGGSAGEIMTVYSVVNTLTELPGVREVRWRVEGRQVETLVGHLDLSGPLTRSADVIVPRWLRPRR